MAQRDRCRRTTPCTACAHGDEDHCTDTLELEGQAAEVERLAAERAASRISSGTIRRPARPTAEVRRSALAALLGEPQPSPRLA